MNFSPLIALSALLHLYVGARVLPELAPYPAATLLLTLLLLASVVCLPLGMLARRVARPPLSDVLTWIGLVFMGLFSSLFVLTLLRDAALALAGLAHWLMPGEVPLAELSFWSALAVPSGGLIASGFGFLNARRTAAIVRIDVPIAGLPLALQGFTVAQITDVHVGTTIKRGYLRRIVAKVNSLKPDMVAITGDLVDGQVHELAAHVAPLADLRSRHGSYFVTGNHEYYAGAHAWMAELRRLGIKVLMNEHVVLEHRPQGSSVEGSSACFVVAGVADWSAHVFDPSHRSDPHAALLGAPGHAQLRMLLAHQPRSAPAAAAAGFDLQLSGHTHGGQFWPWIHFVRFQQPFTAGLHKLGAMWVYTSRGTGYWGPPKRFGAPSEITCLRLIAA
jgi:predicted MPP superfamily phosphohydrolase